MKLLVKIGTQKYSFNRRGTRTFKHEQRSSGCTWKYIHASAKNAKKIENKFLHM